MRLGRHAIVIESLLRCGDYLLLVVQFQCKTDVSENGLDYILISKDSPRLITARMMTQRNHCGHEAT
jgi:hypothetical protein